jgi:hypothetical protein
MGIIGQHSLHKDSNNNGMRLIDYAASRNMVIGITMFSHKEIHKATWKSLDGRTYNQIDHVLIDARHRSNLIDVRSYRGANVDSDHFLIMAKIQHKISRYYIHKHLIRTKKFDIEKMGDPVIKNGYVTALAARLTSDGSSSALDKESWTFCKQVIIDTAEEVINVKGKTIRKEWYDDECHYITQEKNTAYKEMVQRYTRNTVEKYKKLRRMEKRMHKSKKKTIL